LNHTSRTGRYGAISIKTLNKTTEIASSPYRDLKEITMSSLHLRGPMTSTLIFVIAALLLSGCAGLQKAYEPPRVTLSNMTIIETKALETAFLIELRILNANDVQMEIKGVDCVLKINGKPFAAGVSGVEKTIPAYGTDVVPVVVYASVLDTVNRVLGIIGSAVSHPPAFPLIPREN